MIKNFKKFFLPKYKIRGECNKCGDCCRNITFKIQDKYVTTQEEFDRLKKWDDKYHSFFISDQSEDSTMIFTCKFLGEDNLCKAYPWRGLTC